ncbi:hypothetical protein BC938DRAFT_480815 [Jimgerdemannia flammicorona]|uniref:Uncharacterized protein n=1 Tax=Jimgerdemannia flammicorona TaxID=994334 RepID=A0A433QHS5_9FUNG|nr:hypothetical protein BC938DRAFT_480815 [Jimgerdemannia flammicorona]
MNQESGRTSTHAGLAPQLPREKLHSMGEFGEDVADTIGEQTRGILGRFNDIMNRFPPLKWGVYTMAILSAIPVAMFIGFLSISFAVLSGIAAVVVSLFEGGAVLLGGAFLLPTLFGAGVVTFFVVGGFLLAWIASFAVTRIWGFVSRMFSNTAMELEGDIRAAEGGVKRGMQIRGSGRDGI